MNLWMLWLYGELLLGGLALFLIVIPIILLVGWLVLGSVRQYLWKARRRRVRQEAHDAKFRPDGAAYPPSGEGMCDACQKGLDKVYYLPTGRRLCSTCYQIEEMPQPLPEAEQPAADVSKGHSA